MVGTAAPADRRGRGPASAFDVRRSAVRGFAFFGAFLLTLAAITAIGPSLIHESPLEDPQAILSLGSHEHERLPHTAALAQRWPDAQVLLTQPRVPNGFNCVSCPYRVEWLGSLGVARDRVVVLTPSVANTRDELLVARQWMQMHGFDRLLVVTSPYHTRRVDVIARRELGGSRVGIAACWRPTGMWWLTAYGRRYVVYEVAALVANAWRYGYRPWRTT